MKTMFFSLLLLAVSIFSFGQVALRIGASVAVPTRDTVSLNFLFMDTLSQPSGANYSIRVGSMPFLLNHIQNRALNAVDNAFITSKLGYIPYPNNNPNGYINSYTETDPMFNTKFSGKNTDSLAEGTVNQYFTIGKFNSALSTKTTSDINEGTNLYWTQARFNSAFSGKSTSDLPEGTNLYFTNARAISAVNWSSLVGKPNFATVATTGSYNSLSDKPVIPSAQVNSDWNAVSGVAQILNKPSIPAAQIQSDWNQTNSSALDFIKNKPFISTGTGASVIRSLNTNFTPSTTKNTSVAYRVTCSVTNPLLIGTSSAAAFLEYSVNGGSSWVTVDQTGNTSSVALTVTVQLTNTQTTSLQGVIPTNAIVRIRTATSGTASVSFVSGWEI